MKGQTSSVDAVSASGNRANAFAHMTEEFSVLSMDVITFIIRSIRRNLNNKFGGPTIVHKWKSSVYVSEVVSLHHTATHGSDWS